MASPLPSIANDFAPAGVVALSKKNKWQTNRDRQHRSTAIRAVGRKYFGFGHAFRKTAYEGLLIGSQDRHRVIQIRCSRPVVVNDGRCRSIHKRVNCLGVVRGQQQVLRAANVDAPESGE